MTRRAVLNNLLGFPDGITGPELVELGQQHAKRAGADWEITEVTAIHTSSDRAADEGGDRGRRPGTDQPAWNLRRRIPTATH